MTPNTAPLHAIRASLLSANGANIISYLRMAYLRVAKGEHLSLLRSIWRSLFVFDTTNPAVDDSPAVGTLGTAIPLFGNQPIDEWRSWSPGIRRSRFKQQT